MGLTKGEIAATIISFDPEVLTKIVLLQRRSYALLRWFQEGLEKGVFPFRGVHGVATGTEAAVEFIRENYSILPSHCRPDSPEDIPLFANLFASYLETSFDLDEDPGTLLITECGCPCPFCARLVAARQLRPKSITPADKRCARDLQVEYVKEQATRIGVTIGPAIIEGLVDDESMRESVALATYGSALIRRTQGEIEGAALLVLWRRFAWTPEGSPKKNFELTAEAIITGEAQVLEALHRLGAGT